MKTKIDNQKETVKADKQGDFAYQSPSHSSQPSLSPKEKSGRALRSPALKVRLESGFKAKEVNSPLWISVSEAANLGGVQHKTIRRAIKDDPRLRYRIVKDRYQIEFGSLIKFLHKNTKLNNKLLHSGLGQYVEKWRNY